MAHIQYVDSLIREYLLYRGFSSTLKHFDVELKNDKDKSFRADRIIDQITHNIYVHDLVSLRDLWTNLDEHLFNKLDHSFSQAVRGLEQDILKLFLITAYNKPDRVSEFFTKLAADLHTKSEWKEWFYFPFCKNPEEHPIFGVCFTKQWQDTLLISLHNFLATIFQCLPLPTLTRIESEMSLIRKLQEENATLRNRLHSLTNHNSPGAGTHQSRITAFIDRRPGDRNSVQNLNEIVPFDIPPPAHIVDDFYIIAQETLNIGNATDSQVRGLKSLIRNISSGGSPVLGRKESSDRNKKRSGSVGSRTWTGKDNQ